MSNDLDLVVAMPCFNEADGLARTMDALISFLHASNLRFGVVVQDDCSTDDSFLILKQLALKVSSPIAVEQNRVNLGHGPTSLRAYVRALQFEPSRVLFLDSDGQYELSDLSKILEIALKSELDVVLGVRGDRHDPLYRRLVTRVLKIVVRQKFGIVAKDPNTPIRLFSARSLRDLLPKVPSYSLIPNIWLTIRAKEGSYSVLEIPVRHRQRAGLATTGTTWRTPERSMFGPVRRFSKFAALAARELITR